VGAEAVMWAHVRVWCGPPLALRGRYELVIRSCSCGKRVSSHGAKGYEEARGPCRPGMPGWSIC
jgi:hypothetical protein